MKHTHLLLSAFLLPAIALLATAGDTENPIQTALDSAIDDERKALAFYEAVIEKHGSRRPFSNIVHAERRHEQALLSQYDRLGLTPPHDSWANHEFVLPETFAEACDTSVVAEIRNARIYDNLLDDVHDEQVLKVFDNLRNASIERHLRAFRRHSNGWAPIDESQLTDVQRAQLKRALVARDEMFSSLFSELVSAMADSGPSGAIEVCSSQAPIIADRVAAEYDLRIGRTSDKLRNQSNTRPIWAELMIDDRPESPSYTADRSGRLGALLPIKTAAACLQCHGSRADLAPGVEDQLEKLYPDDSATGYAENDLRGWFWIEVPPAE